ncbi:MAG: ATP-binding protein [Synergistaceae bacterium]|nr:ATP-binding protein [Synergistaceae bacterium]
MIRELIPFRGLERDEVFACITGLIRCAGDIDEGSVSESARWYCDCVAKMAAAAEEAGIEGDIWRTWIALLLAESENPFSLARERRGDLPGTMRELAMEDFETIFDYMNYDLRELEAELGVDLIGRVGSFRPAEAGALSFGRAAGAAAGKLAAAVGAAASPRELYDAAAAFYRDYGVGKFALYNGFRWDAEARDIVPALPLEDISFDGLVGYEEQKARLRENTEAFLEGRPANNVLLYGEAGTGKSSSIKALLNEYAPRGLRMIEVYKHQIADLETLLDIVKRRNYKFILFMDDLSFEQFEVEYKFLKAFIEGGLEKRPDNVLIYATSNRRHLMKESWSDRADKDDDMHESETMQEKMSLVDRFGLLIRYLSPEQKEYFDIVHRLAAEYGVEMEAEELEKGAVRWELRHGGFSGRAARQYIEHLAGRAEK